MKLKKILSETLLECQTVWIQIWTNVLSVLTWVQTVCKGYQQTRKVTASKERVNFSKTRPVLSSHSKRTPKIGFHYQLSLNAGQKYCRMLQGTHSAILSTFIKLLFSIKTFVLSILSGHLRKVLLYVLESGHMQYVPKSLVLDDIY